MKFSSRVLLLVLTMAGSGCVHQAQAIVVSPALVAPMTRTGTGQRVSVVVLDERAQPSLGARGFQNIGADLTLAGDIASIVSNSIVDGMKAQNFAATADSADVGRTLRVEIRAIEYDLRQGMWSGSLRVSTSFKGYCIRDAARPYEHVYNGEHLESGLQIIPSSSENNVFVSDSVSKAVNALVADAAMMACLAL